MKALSFSTSASCSFAAPHRKDVVAAVFGEDEDRLGFERLGVRVKLREGVAHWVELSEEGESAVIDEIAPGEQLDEVRSGVWKATIFQAISRMAGYRPATRRA